MDSRRADQSPLGPIGGNPRPMECAPEPCLRGLPKSQIRETRAISFLIRECSDSSARLRPLSERATSRPNYFVSQIASIAGSFELPGADGSGSEESPGEAALPPNV